MPDNSNDDNWVFLYPELSIDETETIDEKVSNIMPSIRELRD